MCTNRCTGYLIGGLVVALAAVSLFYIRPGTTAHLDGWTTDEFREVARVFGKAIARGNVKGSSFAVYYKHQLVVELAGGYADLDAKRKLYRKTHLFGISLSKAIGTLLAAAQVENGTLKFSDRISSIWEEFGRNDKFNITMEHLLTHRAGLFALPGSKLQALDVISDSDALQRALVEARPLTTVGGAPHFHVNTFGLLLDAVLKRVDAKGRRTSELIHDLNKPCGTKLAVGLPLSDFWRIARLYPESVFDILTYMDAHFLHVMYTALVNGGSIPINNPITGEIVNGFSAFYDVLHDFQELPRLNDPHIASMPTVSTNVHGVARDFAKLFSLLVDGQCASGSDENIELRGKQQVPELKRVFSQSLVDELHRVVSSERDGIMLLNQTSALAGIVLRSPAGSNWLCISGYGGQIACVDREQKLTFAYLTNYLQPTFYFDYVGRKLVDATYKAVIGLEKTNNA